MTETRNKLIIIAKTKEQLQNEWKKPGMNIDVWLGACNLSVIDRLPNESRDFQMNNSTIEIMHTQFNSVHTIFGASPFKWNQSGSMATLNMKLLIMK